MGKNSLIKFKIETELEEGADKLREESPNLKLFSKSGFYYLIFKLGLLKLKEDSFGKEVSLEFKKNG